MKYILQEHTPLTAPPMSIVRQTKFYTEYIAYWGLHSARWRARFCFYMVPYDSNEVLVVTCWDDFFDRVADAGFEFMQRTFPSTWYYANNTHKKDFVSECLIKTRDIDTDESKWFLVSRACYLDFDSAKEEADTRIQRKRVNLGNAAGRILTEFDDFDSKVRRGVMTNVARQLGRGLLKGAIQIIINTVTQKVEMPPLAPEPPWLSVAQATEVISFASLSAPATS